MAELSKAHRRSQAKCQLVQSSYIKTNYIVLVCHIINILLTELSRYVWENLDLGRVYKPNAVRSVLTTSVKIAPYRPSKLGDPFAPLACLFKQIIGSLRNHKGDAEDNADKKTNLCFTYESRNILKSFTLFITVDSIAKINLEHNDKFDIKILKGSRRGPRSTDDTEFGHFKSSF